QGARDSGAVGGRAYVPPPARRSGLPGVRTRSPRRRVAQGDGGGSRPPSSAGGAGGPGPPVDGGVGEERPIASTAGALGAVERLRDRAGGRGGERRVEGVVGRCVDRGARGPRAAPAGIASVGRRGRGEAEGDGDQGTSAEGGRLATDRNRSRGVARHREA